MSWYRVTFDLDRDQPPDLSPQWLVADKAIVAYESLGSPVGFAVYDLKDLESMLYSFFYSPIAAQHFLEFIKSNRSEVWDKRLPEGVHLIVGDPTILPGAD